MGANNYCLKPVFETKGSSMRVNETEGQIADSKLFHVPELKQLLWV